MIIDLFIHISVSLCCTHFCVRLFLHLVSSGCARRDECMYIQIVIITVFYRGYYKYDMELVHVSRTFMLVIQIMH